MRIIAPLALGAGLLGLYLASLAPGLTWANGGSDGGDLIAATATGGVAHPTGYPVYMLVARLFQLIPLGSLAWRTNLLSAAAVVAAALLVYAIVRRALLPAGPAAATWGGLVGGLALGLAPLVWSQALITEVYGLNLFFVALLLYLLTLPPVRPRGWNIAIGLVQGLAVGNQILAALLIPATLASITLARRPHEPLPASEGTWWRTLRLDRHALFHGCLGLMLGLLSYAILPLRAVSHPAVNWGDVVSADRFFWLVSGSLYQNELMQVNLQAIGTHLQAWASLILRAFGVAGLAAALTGLIVFFIPSRLHFLTLWITVAFTAFAVEYQVVDSFVYLLPAFLAFAIWIGLGVGSLIHILSGPWPRAGLVIGLVCLGYLALPSIARWPQADAAHDARAETFGREVMAGAPANAILFAQGDQAVFTLWYYQYALKQRSDVAVIATDLLGFDWYRANLRYTYPGVTIPESPQYPWIYAVRQANPGRPTCYPYAGETSLNCQ